MKCCLWIALFCGVLASGCKTTSVRPADDAAAAARPSTNQVQKAVPLDQQAFVVVAATNSLDPHWLRAPTNFFRLGPGDVFDIEILGEGGARSSALVGPDGKVYFGLLPGVFVWGLTLTEAKNVLDENLQKFFRERPQVVLTLRGVASQRIWILGNVQSPGVYPLATPTTLLEAVSLAGGTTDPGGGGEADLRNSFVMREGRLLSIDFYRLLQKGDLSQNIYLQPDDFVYLKPGGGQFVYLLGAVGRSGPVAFADKISLVAAMSAAGGTIPYAQFWEVAVVRGSLTNPSVATVNYKAIIKGEAPDVLLEAGDIVYVPFSPFRKVGRFADSILKQFVHTIAVNEGIRAVGRGRGPVGISVGVNGGFGTGISP